MNNLRKASLNYYGGKESRFLKTLVERKVVAASTKVDIKHATQHFALRDVE